MLSPESLPLTPPQPDPPSRPKYPVNFTMLDLELLHYFILEAAESYLEKSNIAEAFRTSVLQIAFEHPFLMHELLSLSALSLAHHRPEKRDVYLHASDTHAAAGLALFQPEVANLGPGNCHACFVFSTTFLTHAWVAQDLNKPSTLFFRSHIEDHESVTIQWVKLHRGTNAILDQFFPLFCEGPLKALLSPWKDLDPDRADPINEEEERHLHFLAEAWRDSLILSEDEKHILDKAALAVRRVYSMLVYYPEVGRLSVVMNWFSIIPDEFVKMVCRVSTLPSLLIWRWKFGNKFSQLEEKRPEALLVAIYQCVALKQLDHVWWTQGKAENLFKTLYDVLPDQWEAWTLWPMEKVFGSKDALLRKQWKIPNET
jgi:hypothetical protein